MTVDSHRLLCSHPVVLLAENLPVHAQGVRLTLTLVAGITMLEKVSECIHAMQFHVACFFM